MITQNLKGECYFIFKVALNWLIDTWVLYDYLYCFVCLKCKKKKIWPDYWGEIQINSEKPTQCLIKLKSSCNILRNRSVWNDLGWLLEVGIGTKFMKLWDQVAKRTWTGERNWKPESYIGYGMCVFIFIRQGKLLQTNGHGAGFLLSIFDDPPIW